MPVSANSSVTTLSLMNYLSMTICKHPPNPSSRQTDYRSVPICKQADETKFSITYSSVILSHRKCTRLPSTCTPTWSRESGRDFQMLMLDISLTCHGDPIQRKGMAGTRGDIFKPHQNQLNCPPFFRVRLPPVSAPRRSTK